MRAQGAIIIAILLSLGIRISFIIQTQGLALEAYETLVYALHVTETALPLTQTTAAWGGAFVQTTPLFYYLLAIASLFVSLEVAALWIPNIMISLLPIPVYLLAQELTKNKKATITATIASALIPALYPETLFTASPLTLALPLFFLAYYFFIRIAKTPKYQIHFIVTLAILTFTHPISLLLFFAMGITMLLTHVQKTRFSKRLAEVSLFTGFFTIWANVIIYKNSLQWHGINVLRMTSDQLPDVATLATLTGVITLTAGVWTVFTYLTEEKNTTAHALIGLTGAILIGMITTLLSVTIGILLLATTLTILTAGAIQKYTEAKRRARTPRLYTTMFIVAVVLFVVTTAVPAITLGAQSTAQTITQHDQEVLSVIPRSSHVLWDDAHGHFLQYHGHSVPYDTNTRSHPESLAKIEQINTLYTIRSEIRLMQALNDLNVQVVVLTDRNLPMDRRCFTRLHNTHEVYQLTCVVQ